jgi:tetratricopeptide (TPR) repeat protein
MDKLEKTTNAQEEFSFKNYFVPLTTAKAITWIVIIGLLVYANMLFNGFVWDDLAYIVQNPLVHSFNIPLIFGKNFYNIGTQYRPLPALLFATEYALFTTTPFYYHFLELLLHITNAILVFYLFKKFFNNTIAFFLALVFLVHPLQVESVSYIGSSDNPLFFLLGIGALLLSFKEFISWKRVLFIDILLFLSLLTKETGILFIFLILGYRILFNKKQKGLFTASSLITVFFYGLLRVTEVGIGYTQSTLSLIAGVSFIDRLVTMPAVISYYLENFIFPWKIAVDQLWVVRNIDFIHFYMPFFIDCLALFSIFLLGIHLRKNNKKSFPVFLFFTFWSLLGFGMYSQIIPLDFTVSDRWFYFPIIGLLGLIGLFLQSYSFVEKKKNFVVIICLGIIILLSLRTVMRNTNWVDNLTLFTHDNKIVENYDIENNLGSEYFGRGDYSQALVRYKRSYMLLPYEINTYNLGVTYESLGNIPQAEKYYLLGIQQKKYLIDSGYKEQAYESLAKIYTFREKPTGESLGFIKKGLQLYPDSGYLWADLACMDYSFGYYNQALQAATNAKNLLPIIQTAYIYNQISTRKKITFNSL